VMKVRWFFSAVAMLVLTACPSGNNSADETTRETKLYAAVISDLSNEFEVRELRPDREPVVYIESFDVEGVPLQVQVELVREFLDVYDIRFVDIRDEALDDEFVRLPVRTGGVLVGLAPIEDNDDTMIRAELYVDLTHVKAWQFSLTAQDDGWAVADRTVVPARGFSAR